MGGETLRFFWALAVLIILAAILPGQVGVLAAILIALGAVLLTPNLPEFLQALFAGGAG